MLASKALSGLKLAAELILFITLVLFHVPSAASATPPPQIEPVSSLGGNITSVAVSGNVAYVGQGGTFAALDVSDPGNITRLSYLRLPDFAKRIRLVGTLAFIADGNGGLQIANIGDPNHLQLLGSYVPGSAVL